MARDYKARFYTDSSNLKGYLKTEQKVTPEYAKQAKNDWKAQGTAADVKVLGNNLTYVPLDMKPADLQFLETQKFDTTQIARLLGIPASIMLAAAWPRSPLRLGQQPPRRHERPFQRLQDRP